MSLPVNTKSRKTYAGNNQGFTFMELLVVIILLSLFSSIGYPSLHREISKREFQRTVQFILADLRLSRENSKVQREEIVEDELHSMEYGIEFTNSFTYRTFVDSIAPDDGRNRRYLSEVQELDGGAVITNFPFEEESVFSIVFDQKGMMYVTQDGVITTFAPLRMESAYTESIAIVSLDEQTGAFELEWEYE